MRITFQNNDFSDAGVQKINNQKDIPYRNEKSRDIASKAGQLEVFATYQAGTVVENCSNYLPGMEEEKGKTSSFKEFWQGLACVDVAVQQDYMTLMSHIMSEEDYARMTEDGFSFEQMDPETAVTIVDKIKAELARSGQVIVGYTDDLDVDTLAKAVGSEALARTVADSFRQADLPMSREMSQEIGLAWDMASKLQAPTEGSCQYMLENGLEPEIQDFYMAQSSCAKAVTGQGTETALAVDNAVSFDGMEEQLDYIIRSTGRDVDDRSRAIAKSLMKMGVSITADNMNRLESLQSVEFPVTEEVFARAVANAVAEGKNPIWANLSNSENMYDKVAALLDKYQANEGWEQFSQDINARKMLEEVRLHMTAEVNLKLIKSGFAIDTAPMEELIDALKEAERQVAQSYFPAQDNAVEHYRLYNETNRVVGELPGLPAQILGPYAIGGLGTGEVTISRFHEEGKAVLDEVYRSANASYEALMTAPRSDLGDSIQKAFGNVNAILEDLGLELTEKNRRSVRILGYNCMEITPENIEKVARADERVQQVIRRMKPAATLQMIRDGINPLESSFEDLQNYLDNQSESYEDAAESYSKFLYGLEKQNDITAEERSAYIGIYRMLYQIEHSDGAAVGALVNTRAEIQFDNLLAAVRTGKFKHLDVKVEDGIGTLSELVQKGESISDQIMRGFAKDTAEYHRNSLKDIRAAVQADGEAVGMLQRGELPVNAANLLAAQGLVENKLFKDLEERLKKSANKVAKSEELLECMEDKESMQENYTDMLEELSQAVELATFEDADSSLDVKGLKMLHKQLTVAAKLSDSEEYVLPMYIGDQLANVRLRLEGGTEEKGGIHIAVNLSEEGRLEAHFTLQNGKLGGFLIGNTEEEVRKLQKAVDIFSSNIRDGHNDFSEIQIGELPIMSGEMTGRDGNTGREAGANKADGADNKELYLIAKAFLQAIRAN